MEDYAVHIIDLPCNIKAFTSYQDDFYNIYVNARLDQVQQKEAIIHELQHIEKDDFSDRDVSICERM